MPQRGPTFNLYPYCIGCVLWWDVEHCRKGEKEINSATSSVFQAVYLFIKVPFLFQYMYK